MTKIIDTERSESSVDLEEVSMKYRENEIDYMSSDNDNSILKIPSKKK